MGQLGKYTCGLDAGFAVVDGKPAVIGEPAATSEVRNGAQSG